jgi:hypothetical protein
LTDGAMPSRMLRTVSTGPTLQSFALGHGRIKPATNLVSFDASPPAAGHCVGLAAHMCGLSLEDPDGFLAALGPVEATP